MRRARYEEHKGEWNDAVLGVTKALLISVLMQD